MNVNGKQIEQKVAVSSKALYYSGGLSSGTEICTARAQTIGVVTPSPYSQTASKGWQNYYNDYYNDMTNSWMVNNSIHFSGCVNCLVGGFLLVYVLYNSYVFTIGGGWMSVPHYIIELSGFVTGEGDVGDEHYLYVQSDTQDVPHNPIPSGSYILYIPADWTFSTNVWLSEESYVVPEHQEPDLASGAFQLAPKNESIYACYRHNWYGGAGLLWYSLRYKKELPCRLPIGFFAFRSQSSNWVSRESDSSIPQKEYINPMCAPFTIHIERPQVIFDLGSNLYTESINEKTNDKRISAEYSSTHQKIWSNTNNILSSNPPSELIGRCAQDGNLVVISKTWSAFSGVYNPWISILKLGYMVGNINDSGFAELAHYPNYPQFGSGQRGLEGNIATAIKAFNGNIHVGEIEYESIWKDAGSYETYFNLYDGVVEYNGGIALIAGGKPALEEHDVIRLATPMEMGIDSPPPLLTYAIGKSVMLVDSTTDIFRDLRIGWYWYNDPSLGWIKIYITRGFDERTHLAVFPYPMNELNVLDQYFYNQYPQSASSKRWHDWGLRKMVALQKTGLWTIWVNGIRHVMHTCTDSIEAVEEGQELDYQEQRIAGKKIQVKKQKISTDEFELCMIELPKGYFPVDDQGDLILPTVVGGASQRLNVIDSPSEIHVYPVSSNDVYLYRGIGDNYNENYLVFHPSWLNANMYVTGSYIPSEKDLYISHFAELDGTLYACEYGSGKWYRYDATPTIDYPYGQAILVGAVKVKEAGLNSNIVTDGESLWTITQPEGVLAKFGKEHTGHLENLIVSDKSNVANVLGSIAQAFNMIVDYNVKNQIVLRDRDYYGKVHEFDDDTIYLPSPITQTELFYDTIEVKYANGRVKSGTSKKPKSLDAKYIFSKPHAQIISDKYHAINMKQLYSIDIKMDTKYDILDTVNINNYIGKKNIQTYITNIKMDYDKDQLTLQLRKKS